MKKKIMTLPLVGLALVITLLALPSLAKEKSGEPAKPPETAQPAAADLREKLEAVFASLRKAQLNKDIDLYMSLYTHTPPDRNKSTNTLIFWEHHDVTKLEFIIQEIQLVNPNNAVAIVTATQETRDRRTGEVAKSTDKNKVNFTKDKGTWLIRSLESVK